MKKPAIPHHSTETRPITKPKLWPRIRKPVSTILLGIGMFLLISIMYFQFRPLNVGYLQSIKSPIRDFQQADQMARDLVAKDEKNTSLNPDCHYRYLSQPKPVEHVLVIRHGLTNCPRQFDQLADEYYKAGYAVLITRIPYHGLVDRKSPDQSLLTAEMTLSDLNRSIDIAQGLGSHVDVMGLSVGANEVAMVATQRADIDRAIIINPFFGIKGLPAPLTRMATGAALTIPNQFIWWDGKAKELLSGPTSASYGFQTHSIGEYLRITAAIFDKPNNKPLAARPIIITNANDDAVNNKVTDEIIEQWQKTGANLVTYRFPESDKLNHDLIDPLQDDARIDISYPKILELTR
ncbi:MAG: hypothetical protein WCO19_04775 [Candidatus Saccharibacteria bacterium]